MDKQVSDNDQIAEQHLRDIENQKRFLPIKQFYMRAKNAATVKIGSAQQIESWAEILPGVLEKLGPETLNAVEQRVEAIGTHFAGLESQKLAAELQDLIDVEITPERKSFPSRTTLGAQRDGKKPGAVSHTNGGSTLIR